CVLVFFFFFQAEDGIRDFHVTGVQTCALPILALAHGAFDDPAALPPAIQYGIEGKLPFADHLGALPARPTGQEPGSYLARVVSRQHPDHDTAEWPPRA